ncbi:MAG TPA: GDP-mannose pyrophosphatase NudK [Saprospiraceae bacterium]|nr:GDP-mannose pyrophosphatase NudK [Saprospiraceae bacterium]HNT22262.1 GDP-mannose pyrophosphatase NudK [Saprospiraceae bacterium]
MPNPHIEIIDSQILSDQWYVLKKITFRQEDRHGHWHTVSREAYDRGNGAVILLYHKAKKTVVLTRQFRMPTYLNGNDSGMLIEACAGLLDHDEPEDCIRKETEEETGFVVREVRKIFEAYMSPGSVTEVLHFFVAEYDDAMKKTQGGGLARDHELIEVLEIPFDQSLGMIASGEIRDAKTILLLQYAALNNLFENDK